MTMATIGRSMKKRVIGWPRGRSGAPGASFAVTGVPARRYCSPLTITFSPAFRPFSMTQRSPHARPGLDGADLRLAVRAHDRRHAIAALQLRRPRAAGRASAPGRHAPAGADLRVLAGAEDVVGVREEALDGHGAGLDVHFAVDEHGLARAAGRRFRPRGSARGQARAPSSRSSSRLMLAARFRYSRSEMPKVTRMGSTVDTVVMTVCGLTRSPTCVRAMPAMPSIGEVTRVQSRFRSACSTAARAAATPPRASRSAASALSSSCWLMARWAASGVKRSTSLVGLRELGLRAGEGAARLLEGGPELARVDLEERVRRAGRTAPPCRTAGGGSPRPSAGCRRSRSPSRVPIHSPTTGTSCWMTGMTRTSTGAGGGASLPRQPAASNEAARASVNSPAVGMLFIPFLA